MQSNEQEPSAPPQSQSAGADVGIRLLRDFMTDFIYTLEYCTQVNHPVISQEAWESFDVKWAELLGFDVRAVRVATVVRAKQASVKTTQFLRKLTEAQNDRRSAEPAEPAT